MSAEKRVGGGTASPVTGEVHGEGDASMEPVPASDTLLCHMALMLGGASFRCIEDANHDGPHALLACWADINGRTRTTTAMRVSWSCTYDVGREEDVLFARPEEEARADALKTLGGEA